LVALTLANSPYRDAYRGFWQTPLAFEWGGFHMRYSLQLWINDGLMAIFFFVVGLEVKREMVWGELREFKKAVLPIAAALGGMVVPAAIYLSLQYGSPGERGWGIPMATDIAFVVGCMALIGPRRIPNGLRVMILTLAIADDIGAILVIAIGYTKHLDFQALFMAAVGVGLFVVFLKSGVKSNIVYLTVGTWIWFEVHASGIHATVAGVIIGMMTPTRSWVSEQRFHRITEKTHDFLHRRKRKGPAERYAMIRLMEQTARDTLSPVERLETNLHPWVSFFIMPLFALANAGVTLELSVIAHPVAMAVILGLLLGKPIGIMLFSWAAVTLKFARIPDGVTWPMLLGGAVLGGIGFTMALFIASLALQGGLLDAAKVGVMAGSLLSSLAGSALIFWAARVRDGAASRQSNSGDA
jgi:NhaA family Na+:H+ antiporter